MMKQAEDDPRKITESPNESAIQMEVVADVYQHQQQTQQQSQRNIQSTQTRPYSNAERQRRYREKRKADKMNACSTFSQSSDVQPQQEQPQHNVQINKRQPQSNAERQRKYRKLLREQKQQHQQMEDINAITMLSNTPSIHQLQNVDQAEYARKRLLNKQRQSRFRARQRFESPSTSPNQAQTESKNNGNIVKNMAMLTDHNYTLRNEIAAINYLIPVMSRDVVVHDIDVKVENDLSVNQGRIITEDRIDYNTETKQTSPLYVAIDDIKVEYDEAVNQDITDQQNISSVIHDIKVETEDPDVECGSTTTNDFVIDDIKVEVIQEIITPEEFTNIEMMCRSTLPTDVGVDGVKVEDCGMMNQDGASDSATDTDVKCRVLLLGEDYSSVDGLPSAETIHKVESSDTEVPQVKKISEYFMSLAYDVKTHSKERPYSCAICKKAFKLKRNLKQHINIHLGVKPYSCQVCHKSFPHKRTLTSHLRTHTGEKPFSCHICNKTFSLKGNLTSHVRLHLGEKLYSCEICHKSFNHKFSLTDHFKGHTGEKPFSCQVCHKRFIRKGTLTSHLMTHSGIKPFSCDNCNRAFVQKCNLLKHMEIHSGEKPFSCDVCGEAFRRRFALKSHKQTHLITSKANSVKLGEDADTRNTVSS